VAGCGYQRSLRLPGIHERGRTDLSQRAELAVPLCCGSGIEKSTDSGQTWQVDFKLGGSQQAQVAYYQKVREATHDPSRAAGCPGRPQFRECDFCHGTGRSSRPPGQWNLAVGDGWQIRSCRIVAGNSVHSRFVGGEIIAAAWLSFELINTWLLRRRNKILRIVQAVLAWLLWVFQPSFSAGLNDSYAALISTGLLILIAVVVIPFGIENLVFLARRSLKRMFLVGLYALIGGVLVLMPYILWSLNAIPSYTLAAGFALILGIVVGVLAISPSADGARIYLIPEKPFLGFSVVIKNSELVTGPVRFKDHLPEPALVDQIGR